MATAASTGEGTAGSVTPPDRIDSDLLVLAERARGWADLPLEDRIDQLRRLLRRTAGIGPRLVRACLAAKGVGGGFEGEEWVATVAVQLRAMRSLLHTLEGVQRHGRVPIAPRDIAVRGDGQVVIRVIPMDRWDRALFPGWRGEVWVDPGVTSDILDHHLGSFYTKPGPADAGVAAVLGAGNVASIAPLDAIHMLFVSGMAVMVKFNPVNEYIGPFFEEAFSGLIEAGFVRCAYGGAGTGSYLAHHPLVDRVHLTGSSATLDALVYGGGEGGASRRADGKAILTKPVTSELGNVGPVIVVPGRWSDRQLRYQAEHLATQIMQNAGFNCIAARVVVMPRGWEQGGDFLGHLRRVLAGLMPRPAYYPGAVDRWEALVASHPGTEVVGPLGNGVLPPALLMGVDPEADHPAFREEAFCPATVVTGLDAPDAASFLEAAVGFCNHRLAGTLNATILVDPETATILGDRLADAVAGLRYGSVGVNVWGGASYALGTTPWGGFPGAGGAGTVGGSGFVHNTRLIDRPQKTVLYGPFVQVPKPGWFLTHRNGNRAMRRYAAFEADPGLRRFLAAAAASIRG